MTTAESPGFLGAAEARQPTGLRPLSEALDDDFIWSLIDAAPDAIVMVDEAGQMLLVNRQTEQLFGYDRGELLGRTVDELLPDRFRAVHGAHRTRYRVNPRPRPMGTGSRLFGLRRDGTEFPVEISLSPLHDEGGVLRIVAAVRDITERVDAEARSREIHEILDATQDAVSIFDAQNLRFTYVNQGFVDQLGYSRADALTMTMLHIAPDFTEPKLRDLLASFERDDVTSTTFTTVHRRRDGADVPVEILLQPIPAADGTARAYAKIARDISARLQAEAARTRAEQELSLLEDRERMARDLHDLVIQRLFAAGMTAQALASRVHEPELEARAASIVAELDNTIREIRTVIFGMQAPGRSDDHSLRSRILGVVEDERAALGFAPHVLLDGNIDTVADDVSNDLLAILREALSNVAQHAHATRVDITVEVDRELLLRVADNGSGFTSASSAGGGRHMTGQGLRNIAQRATVLGGSFDVHSQPGEGTTVECRLPVRAG